MAETLVQATEFEYGEYYPLDSGYGGFFIGNELEHRQPVLMRKRDSYWSITGPEEGTPIILLTFPTFRDASNIASWSFKTLIEEKDSKKFEAYSQLWDQLISNSGEAVA